MATVYLLSDPQSGFIKIGRADDFETRYKNLRTANPRLGIGYLLETEYASFVEKCMHNRFAHVREEGEFFKIDLIEARAYLEEVEKQSEIINSTDIDSLAKGDVCDDLIDPTSSDWDLINQITELDADISALELKRAALEAQVKMRIGQASGIRNLATWKIQVTSRFDSTLFRADSPDIYEKYQKESRSRIFKFRRYLNTN